jgi:hypothetical protein
MSIEKLISKIFENIDHSKEIIKEVSSSSEELFGGSNVKIPVDGAHAGQSGWHSSNAWDVAAKVGTPVYALASGEATTFSDYGKTVRVTDGKKLFGQSFTVKSDGGLPSIYYTHLEGSPIRKGTKIECGQFLGYITDFPGSNYDHVHIGVERGNIRQFLNDNGTIKCAKGQVMTGGEVTPYSDDSGTSSPDDRSQAAYDYAMSQDGSSPKEVIGQRILTIPGIFESVGFGKNVSNRYGRLIIPKDKNPKIKSPISGVIDNRKYFPNCVNQVTVRNDDNGTTYLQYCGISSPKRLRNEESVSIGDTLGSTDTDVEVNYYDASWNKLPISSAGISIEKSDTDTEKKKNTTEPEYYDPLMAALLLAPSKIFKDKFDKEGNRVEKRYGGVSDKQQVDPFVLNFLKDPFNRKKVNENIEKIKKML